MAYQGAVDCRRCLRLSVWKCFPQKYSFAFIAQLYSFPRLNRGAVGPPPVERLPAAFKMQPGIFAAAQRIE
jgi:hypothetical protein